MGLDSFFKRKPFRKGGEGPVSQETAAVAGLAALAALAATGEGLSHPVDLHEQPTTGQVQHMSQQEVQAMQPAGPGGARVSIDAHTGQPIVNTSAAEQVTIDMHQQMHDIKAPE